ncbi:arylmalonate decarboxylase [Nostoc sp. 3335mG]|nr:arylmalonate decarboxylase [Nostoc sp. 3335mG]
MTDVLGWRKVFGVLGPSTNTVVQPDFDDLRVPGVTNHYSRIIVQNPTALSDADFIRGTDAIDAATHDAVRAVMTCAPDYLVLGMSAVTFYGGAEGSAKWTRAVEDVAGTRLCTGSASLIEAFKAYGGIKRIAVLSPYFPVANEQVRNFMSDHGIEVVRDTPLRCQSWLHIARVTPAQLRDTILDLDGDDVDAIVQVGTNLSMVRLAAAAETFLQKPVIAINAATYWNALRQNGITDRKQGFGRLMAEF